MSSYSYTESITFTVTHARHMAAKIATDLKRIQRLYNCPSDRDIAEYEAEAVAMMKVGYLGAVTYGFKRNGAWIEPTLKYSARDLADGSTNDDDPGRIRPGKDVSGASFASFMTYSDAFFALSQTERDAFKGGLPIFRASGTEPPVDGYLDADRTYSAGGRALDRSTVRSY